MFLADNDSKYFVCIEMIEKFCGSGMLGHYEKQTTLLLSYFYSLYHRAFDQSTLLQSDYSFRLHGHYE